MKITSIKQQLKSTNRYSVFVDGSYSFSLSEAALIESRITNGQEIDQSKLDTYKSLSNDDKLYGRALRYVALRPRSVWEVSDYLFRKGVASQSAEVIIAKLIGLGLLGDDTFARAFVRDRRLLRHSSKRKLAAELRKRRVNPEAIDRALADDESDDTQALRELIKRKRRQLKYQDDMKLMQYLSRQGFGYGDIKSALEQQD